MLETHLKKYFNFSSFRAGQREIIESIVDGHDVVALMPTGGGKSLCFQLPALIGDQVSLVISPLIALMKDQVDSLRARGVAAAFINSALSTGEIQNVMDDVRSGATKLLYVSPERLNQSDFRRFLAEIKINFLAVDEAHCVSQWGHDFRTDYLAIKDFVKTLTPRPVVAAFTATATPEVRDDIIKNLALKNPRVFVRGFDRPNLRFFVKSDLSVKQREKETLRIAKKLSGSGIVYTISRKETEKMADYLTKNGEEARAYHAGMSGDKRSKIQNHFMEGRFRIIVATIAFGMGIDKADIRFVIHAGMPSTIEGYYQESGRAGRDGELAYCVLLHSGRDVGLHNFFILQSKKEAMSQGKSWAEANALCSLRYKRLDAIKDYALGNSCRRRKILEYFADPDVGVYTDKKCGGCDVCLNFKWENSVAKDTKKSRRAESAPAIAPIVADASMSAEDSARIAAVGNLSETVAETVRLYQDNYTPERIAKARNFALTTVWGHLVQWYLAGGGLAVEKYVTDTEEKQILHALADAEDRSKLRSVKDKLPDSIGYEQIRLVIAKVQRMWVGR
ncbi:MAG: ATP-dependent DNA helicase RecQ [Candidatus Amesbacteria bacterium GW2011_GWA2_42_12]|uniref:ATP-dependent DNA helicase RecQ n=1 Tax=Candidatus Amesbacteria bacterium GW2011_GWA2_42_12 TaxID=1618356 RepID=A0A0G0Y545_9BACT|nr:MAG: ATP-dependent DNA helicase RecQ [Candidatus Amesbacteria bacterium GW2011_GWA2_42_12]